MENLKENLGNWEPTYGKFFESFQSAINGLVELVKAFYSTIKAFVDGFQKEVHVNEFEDHQA
jgi:hypothetical protein